jgi:hypothetical protein
VDLVVTVEDPQLLLVVAVSLALADKDHLVQTVSHIQVAVEVRIAMVVADLVQVTVDLVVVEVKVTPTVQELAATLVAADLIRSLGMVAEAVPITTEATKVTQTIFKIMKEELLLPVYKTV